MLPVPSLRREITRSNKRGGSLLSAGVCARASEQTEGCRAGGKTVRVSLLQTWRILGWNTELLAPSECRMKDGRDKTRGEPVAEAGRGAPPQEVEACFRFRRSWLRMDSSKPVCAPLLAAISLLPRVHRRGSLSICVPALGRSSIFRARGWRAVHLCESMEHRVQSPALDGLALLSELVIQVAGSNYFGCGVLEADRIEVPSYTQSITDSASAAKFTCR